MTKAANTPKALLRDRDLIGFKRPTNGGDQIPRRASSAKVTAVEPSPCMEPVSRTSTSGKATS